MISLFGFESVVERLEKGEETFDKPIALRGLSSTSKGLVAVSLAVRLKRPVVIVTDKASRADEFYDTIRFFTAKAEGAPLPLLFPPWEILPYEEMSPHPEVSGQRLSTLATIGALSKPFVLVTTIEALARKILPPDALKRGILKIERNDSIDIDLLIDHLSSFGYRRTDMVEERGEYAVRGGIVDLFEGQGDRPVRIELFGDEVESIRRYNPDTQRSIESIDSVYLYPFREVFYEGINKREVAERFKAIASKQNIQFSKIFAKYEAIANGQFFPGVERLLPLFYPEPVSLFDYMPQNCSFIIDEPEMCENHATTFYDLIESGREEAIEREDPTPDVKNSFLTKDALFDCLAKREIVRLGSLGVKSDDEENFTLSTRKPERYRGDTQKFINDLESMRKSGYRVILVAATDGRAQRLEKFLNESDIAIKRLPNQAPYSIVQNLCKLQPGLFGDEPFGLIAGALTEGVIFPSDKWALITDDEIFGKVVKTPHRSRRARRTFGVGLADLAEGDFITHETHGVGKFIGLKEMTIGDAVDEYLELEYADYQKLFLPISRIDLIKKFVSAGGSAPQLDKMGGSTWRKTKSRVKKAIMEMAERLLKLSASREINRGFAFSADGAFHDEFAGAFEHEETLDQRAAIEDVADDMEKERPMDRLICGDVGYGKTEVAMRAAFKAVFDGKQVALLAPTTLLVQQHYLTFTERFRSFPVTVEALSRFKTAREAKEIVARTKAGGVDILIGTHRLLQKDVSFHNLGLMVIDEEQRFGVRHKEKLKALATNVDVLTLTATPIPRTLHTAMVGIRELSIIETPPVDRLSVRNQIATFSEKIIVEALARELDRGGQVFFVHNKVHSIKSVHKFLQKLAPNARIAVAHGQMPERELEKVMLDFIDKEYDVLLSTTIIESGLDIPAANTMIINRADHFGLSQLYQLRGRVGRDRRRAHCYFLIPGIDTITEVAKRRLKAIEELSELGSGFRLAARDMEIRGAGNLLGPEQSGNIDSVGFDTYTEMLEDSIRELKGEPSDDRFEVAMNLVVSGRVTPEYVPGVNQRIDFYNRLYAAASIEELDDLEVELKDRFGSPPEETEKLLAHARIKLACKRLKVEKVDMIRDRLSLVFDPSTKLKPDRLVTLAAKKGISLRFTTSSTAEVTIRGEGWRERFTFITDFLMTLLAS